MPLACNIDAKGKRMRFVMGVVLTLLGVVAAVFWAVPRGGWIPWTVAAVLFGSGVFGLFEARAGWCALRAMGFKTRI
jgi:uncharacterized membrane protein